MEDLRVVWMRDRVYAALGLQDEGLFRELLAREEGRAERELLAYLDQPAEQLQSSAILFLARKVVVDVEQEDEPEGMQYLCSLATRIILKACTQQRQLVVLQSLW